jgi:hypothetical protein
MVEFRLYYDDNGKVLCYTCEKLEGNYILIDSDTYHQCRPDVCVIDGKIVKRSEMTVIRKLKPSAKGVTCSNDDITMIATEGTAWELTTHEFRHY